MSLVHDVIELIRALRTGPSTVVDLGKRTGLHWRKVYRLLGELRELGAPLTESEDAEAAPVHGGRAPRVWSLSANGLIAWFSEQPRRRRP